MLATHFQSYHSFIQLRWLSYRNSAKVRSQNNCAGAWYWVHSSGGIAVIGVTFLIFGWLITDIRI